MTSYDVVLFDLDNTLSDFDWSKREAFAGLLRSEGIENPHDYLDTFTTLATPLWEQLERGEITLETLNDERFRQLVAHTGLSVDPARLAPGFLRWLGTSGGLVDGAVELLDELHGRVRMGLITNGYAEVQRPRLTHFDLERFFEVVVVSSEIGVAKPHSEFFDVAFDLLGGPDPSSVLVVGDSLTSDIAGGANRGTATCWYNPMRRPTPSVAPRIDHVVHTLGEISPIVLRESDGLPGI